MTSDSDTDIIELNGKRYDARTGHPLSIPKGGKNQESHGKKIKVVHHETPRTTKKPRRIHVRTEKAKTLMRQAVKKPTPAKQIEHKSTAAPPSPEIHRSPSSHLQPDPGRLARAQQVAKSHLINKFGAQAISPIKFITTELPVQPEPVPISSPPEDLPVDSVQTTESQSVWQHAIDQATSHTQPAVKRASHRHRVSQKLGVSTRVVNISATALATILLVGFVAYQQVPNLSMRIAAERAGLPAGLPGYQPAGFGLSGPIHYQPGQITLQFRSHSDDRSFQIHQRDTGWDDVSLVKNYLVPEHDTFQTRQTGDKTVYIYDDDNATWVENGVWYQVEGDSSLTNDQLLHLAASM